MPKSRIVLGALALVIVALAIPSFSGAAKLPTYYRYADCKSKSECKVNIYTNAKRTKAVTLQVTPKCSDGAIVQAYTSAAPRIKKGKFSATFQVTTYPKGGASTDTVRGTLTVDGKYNKSKNRFTGKWSIDKVSANCDSVKTGKYTAKYKSKQQGG